MPDPLALTRAGVLAAPAPSTPLGPFEDSAVTWTTWVALMGFVGLIALALVVTAPVARRIAPAVVAATTTRLVRIAVVFGVLSVPAVLTDVAHSVDETGGYHYGAAWNLVFDGTNQGRLLGLELTLMVVAVLAVAPLAVPGSSAALRPWLLGAGLSAGAVALGTTKFPDEVPTEWGRTVFETGMWMLHLLGGAVWIGGLIGLLALALPGGIASADRGAFWSPVIRRFSITAMACVAAIALSGLWLYWTHVDGPTQLVTTMYGRVLGVKILIFGSMLVLGAANQFWLHPRVDALRAAGDDRPLTTVLVRDFTGVIALEVLLGLSVLMVAPFLHGSARNQAFQAGVEHRAATAVAVDDLPRIADKQVSASTWVWGTSETVAVIAIMVGGYVVSGRLARRRVESAAAAQQQLSPVG